MGGVEEEGGCMVVSSSRDTESGSKTKKCSENYSALNHAPYACG
jgi:hypothetical protein